MSTIRWCENPDPHVGHSWDRKVRLSPYAEADWCTDYHYCYGVVPTDELAPLLDELTAARAAHAEAVLRLSAARAAAGEVAERVHRVEAFRERCGRRRA